MLDDGGSGVGLVEPDVTRFVGIAGDDQNDPQLVGPEQEWPATRVPRLYVRGAWHSSQSTAELFWGRPGDAYPFSGDRVRPFRVVADGRFRTYRVDLFRSPTYRGTIDGIRLDPVYGAEPGAWADITCISWRLCPTDRARSRSMQASCRSSTGSTSSTHGSGR